MTSPSRLVWVTPEAENVISYCARVSNPDNQENYDTAPKLLKYCIKNNHWSVFEMASMCVEITTSRAISAQILRHKSFSFQEFSQRYAEATYWVDVEPRRQDDKNRQNSTDDLDKDIKQQFREMSKAINEQSTRLYDYFIELGVAKESARFLLPMNTMTRLYMSGTIRSWIHYLNLRTANGTQKEHKDIAESIKQIFIKELPSISEVLGYS